MALNATPVLVQDVLSVFESTDSSHQLPAEYIVVQLLTADGVLALRAPRTLAQNLAKELSRAAEQPRSRWAPDYHSPQST